MPELTEIKLVPVGKIHIGERHRQDVGDIEGLADNIREMGLLQPIGVDRYYTLIFGYRRMWACKDLLGWKHIPAIVLDLDSIVMGEFSENEFRKQFTPSERVAIGKAVERELGSRKGQRTDLELKENFPEVPRGQTRDIAAKRAGFRCGRTYESAEKVTELGSPELVKAMDDGRISIDAAAKIATQPKDEQKRIVELPREAQQSVVNQIRKTKADREADDRRAYDLRVYRGLAEAVEQIAAHYDAPAKTWEGLSRVHAYKFSEHLDKAIACLVRLQKEHPNVPRKPSVVA